LSLVVLAGQWIWHVNEQPINRSGQWKLGMFSCVQQRSTGISVHCWISRGNNCFDVYVSAGHSSSSHGRHQQTYVRCTYAMIIWRWRIDDDDKFEGTMKADNQHDRRLQGYHVAVPASISGFPEGELMWSRFRTCSQPLILLQMIYLIFYNNNINNE